MVELSFYEAGLLSVGSLVFGIFLLVRGGGWTVDSAVHIATQKGISPLFVGFVIVGFGTSLPELLVSVVANFQGSAGIALGNVIGSNIANILLILGASAALSPLIAQRSVRRGVAAAARSCRHVDGGSNSPCHRPRRAAAAAASSLT